MALIGAKDRVAVAEAIAAAECRTNAEIVTVLARASDEYALDAMAWAGALAVVLGAVAGFLGFELVWIVSMQLGLLAAWALVVRFSTLAVHLTPVAIRHRRAEDLARRQFLEQRLHHTSAETGFLIFVSEAERYVEILADRGIAREVDDGRWEQIVAAFVVEVRRGRAVPGLIAAIEQCADILAEVVPKTADNTNELDDRLVLIGYD